jgi:hypothetical protein
MCDCCDDNLVNLNASNDGQSAYLYIIYADDLIGTDAQLTVPTCFQAFVNSNVSMTNQEAIDYAINNNLFYDRCGDSGGSGSQGPQGPAGPKGDAGDPACNPLAEISLRFLAEGEEEDLVINFDQDGTECAQTFTGIVFPGNFAASSFFAEVLNSSQFENAVNSAVSGTFSWVNIDNTTITPSNFTGTYSGETVTVVDVKSNDVKYIKIGESVTLTYNLVLEIAFSATSSYTGSFRWRLPSPIKPANIVYNTYMREANGPGGQGGGASYCVTNTSSGQEGIKFSGSTNDSESYFLFLPGTTTYTLSGTITYKA